LGFAREVGLVDGLQGASQQVFYCSVNFIHGIINPRSDVEDSSICTLIFENDKV